MIQVIRRRISPGSRGQALLLFALLFTFLIGLVGLAADGAVSYAYSVSLERAASAAALAGAPYMPGNLATATTRAKAEARRNGWNDGVNATVTVSPAASRQLDVKVKGTVPTFFMAALGIRPFPVTREAVAGYLPPIPLGQPGNQLGSTVTQLGGANQFYFLRFKGNNKIRGEGDPYTPQSFEGNSGPSTDAHTISTNQGNEVAVFNCGGGNALALPCEGGQNYRVVIPAGTRGEIQIYNAAFAPDYDHNNPCENLKNLPTCGSYQYREGTDDGMGGKDMANDVTGPALTNGHCGTRPGYTACDATIGSYKRRELSNTASYTVMAVPNQFVRADDIPIVQTKVFPIDANNWDGNEGVTGPGSTTTPTYVNVKDGNGFDITQQYGVTGCGTCPKNAKFYHSWDNIVTEDGSLSLDSTGVSPVQQTKTANYGTYVDGQGSLAPGTYRVRVDSLNWDGTFGSPSGDASKGYSIRVVTTGALPTSASSSAQCVGTAGDLCTVAGWEDMTLYSPITSPGGPIPLFQLDKDYQGQTILIDFYDVGDAGGQVKLELTDPLTGTVAKTGAGSIAGASGSALKIFNLGYNRLGPVLQTPATRALTAPARSPLPATSRSATPLTPQTRLPKRPPPARRLPLTTTGRGSALRSPSAPTTPRRTTGT